jgi:hypothetical protein
LTTSALPQWAATAIVLRPVGRWHSSMSAPSSNKVSISTIEPACAARTICGQFMPSGERQNQYWCESYSQNPLSLAEIQEQGFYIFGSQSSSLVLNRFSASSETVQNDLFLPSSLRPGELAGRLESEAKGAATIPKLRLLYKSSGSDATKRPVSYGRTGFRPGSRYQIEDTASCQ